MNQGGFYPLLNLDNLSLHGRLLEVDASGSKNELSLGWILNLKVVYRLNTSDPDSLSLISLPKIADIKSLFLCPMLLFLRYKLCLNSISFRVKGNVVARMMTTTAIDEETQKRNDEEKFVVHFSPGYSKEQGVKDVIGLQKPLGKWSIAADGMGVERSFKFRSFKKTWEFMNLVAAEAVQKKHHPEWSNVHGYISL